VSRRPLQSLLTANAISTAGTTMTLLAIPWFVLQTTGSASRTGIAAASETVPLVLASVLGGPVVDRLGARRVSIASDIVSALGIGAIPLLHSTIGLRFWQLCLLIAVVGLARAPGDTSRSVLVPGLVRLAGIPMERATSAYDGVSRGARMVGAPLAGVLIAVWSAADVLLIDGATFLVSALLIGRQVPASVRPALAHEDRAPYLTQLRSGLGYLRNDRLVAGITTMVMVTNLLDVAYSSVFLPVYARDVLHSSVGLGLIAGLFGAGALAGTVLYGVVGPRLPRWPVFTVAFLIGGAPRFFLFAGEPPLVLLLTGCVLAGLAAGAINPVLAAVEFERIPEELQSRVIGVLAAGVMAGMPVGALAGGLLTSAIGLRGALVATGAAYLCTTLAPVVWPVWRQMDADRTVVRRVPVQETSLVQAP
jgi:MFS family permease